MTLFSDSLSQSVLLLVSGFFSGFVDSIAGGGGLINLPILTLLLGPGPLAIGTNKVAGALGAFVALLVYARHGHLNLKRSLYFSSCVALGALIGSSLSPLLPIQTFKWLLAITCPIILVTVWKKELWMARDTPQLNERAMRIFASGLMCGFYDGAWGPGAGIFMLLALLFFGNLPLFAALATSKLTNTSSGTIALTNYAMGGYVNWIFGICMALGTIGGAYVGARYATKKASQIVRPILFFIVVLLMFKIFVHDQA